MTVNPDNIDTNETLLTASKPQLLQHQSIDKLLPIYTQLFASIRDVYDIEKLSKIFSSKAVEQYMSIPDSVLKMIEYASQIAPQQQLFEAMEPIIASTQFIENQIASINSDTFKALGASLSQLNFLSERIADNAFFGSYDKIVRIVQQYTVQQNELLNSFSSGICQLNFDFYPSNLRGIDGIDLRDIQTVVMLDGIALYELPRREITIRLLKAPGNSARRDILGRKWREIAADCRDTLKSCRSAELCQTIAFATNAIDALDSGNYPAAQALISGLIDTVLRQNFLEIKPLLVPRRGNKTSDKYLDFPINQFIALAPVWQAYQSFRPDMGDRIPHTFNRHATTHTVSKTQYSQRNAIQGLMLLCGMIKFIDDDVLCK